MYLRADIARYAVALWRGIRGNPTPHTVVAVSLAVSAIPAALVGLALEDVVLDLAEEPLLIAALLAAFGWLLWRSDATASRRGLQRSQHTYGLRDAAGMGLAQAMALLPGVSRSGVTITAGSMAGLRPRSGSAVGVPHELAGDRRGGPLPRGHAGTGRSQRGAQVQLIVIGAATAVLSSWAGVAAMVRLLDRMGQRTAALAVRTVLRLPGSVGGGGRRGRVQRVALRTTGTITPVALA